MAKNKTLTTAMVLLFSIAGLQAHAQDSVTVKNFARAETDTYIRNNMSAFGVGLGEIVHVRDPISAENQTVIRQQQDTLYSLVVVDLSEPVTIALPDTGDRYQSMHVINQDHYMYVESAAGDYKLTQESVGTRFAMVNFRTFVIAGDPDDTDKARAAQDGIKVTGGGTGPFKAPDWNEDDLAVARRALNDLSTLGLDSRYAFGRKDEVKPVDFLIGAAAGWGGLPAYGAIYKGESVANNDGATPYRLTVSDVPVDAFWSVTVYNADGFLEANDQNRYSFNNVTATPDADGAITVHFGGCEDGRVNCIPVTPGWNYTVRLYEPREDILSGEWLFPDPVPAN